MSMAACEGLVSVCWRGARRGPWRRGDRCCSATRGRPAPSPSPSPSLSSDQAPLRLLGPGAAVQAGQNPVWEGSVCVFCGHWGAVRAEGRRRSSFLPRCRWGNGRKGEAGRDPRVPPSPHSWNPWCRCGRGKGVTLLVCLFTSSRRPSFQGRSTFRRVSCGFFFHPHTGSFHVITSY